MTDGALPSSPDKRPKARSPLGADGTRNGGGNQEDWVLAASSLLEITKLIRASNFDHTEKLFLMTFATYVNFQTLEAFPSVASMASGMSMSERTVQSVRRVLEHFGVLVPLGHRQGGVNRRTGRGRSTRYRLDLDALSKNGGLPPRNKGCNPEHSRVQSTTDKGATHDTTRVQLLHPNQPLEAFPNDPATSSGQIASGGGGGIPAGIAPALEGPGACPGLPSEIASEAVTVESRLQAFGVSRSKARSLAASHDLSIVEFGIEYVRTLENVRNRPALLVTMLDERTIYGIRTERERETRERAENAQKLMAIEAEQHHREQLQRIEDVFRIVMEKGLPGGAAARRRYLEAIRAKWPSNVDIVRAEIVCIESAVRTLADARPHWEALCRAARPVNQPPRSNAQGQPIDPASAPSKS